MLTLFFSICMYRIAEHEKRRGWLWALLTFTISASLQHALELGYWGAVLGLASAYGLMTVLNIYRPVRKGPFLG